MSEVDALREAIERQRAAKAEAAKAQLKAMWETAKPLLELGAQRIETLKAVSAEYLHPIKEPDMSAPPVARPTARPTPTNAPANAPTDSRAGAQLRVLAFDALPLARFGLRTLVDSAPDLTWLGSAGSVRAAAPIVARLRPHVVVMRSTLDPGAILVRQLISSSPLKSARQS